MRNQLHRIILALAAVVLVPAGALSGQETEPGRGYPEQDWPLVGGNWSSSRYSSLTEISTDTVDRLGGAWATRLPGGAASRATPVVQEGALYLPAGANVFKIDAETGETIWRWEPSEENERQVPSWQGVGLEVRPETPFLTRPDEQFVGSGSDRHR